MAFGIIVVANNSEAAYFGSILDMESDAETFVIVANRDNSDGIGSTIGKTLQIETSLSLGLRNNIVGHREMASDDRIDLVDKSLHLIIGRSLRKRVIEFGLLTFDMSRDSTSASEKINHRTIDNVFGSMHRREFLLVMSIELNFHV